MIKTANKSIIRFILTSSYWQDLLSSSWPDKNSSTETMIIFLRMGSQSGNFSRVGDIQLNYLAKF